MIYLPTCKFPTVSWLDGRSKKWGKPNPYYLSSAGFEFHSYVLNMNDSGVLFFVLMAGLAGTMTLDYFPLRFFLTATARSRRLKLLQRIRRLRDELGQPLES